MTYDVEMEDTIVRGMSMPHHQERLSYGSILSTSENITQWNQTYGSYSDDLAYSVIQTDDGGFAFAGATSSFSQMSEDYDGWFVKTDANGVIQFNQTY